MNAKRQLIVFDMDGVLIDVSGSYRETVVRSAALFLRPARGADRLPDPLFPLDDLARIKQGGGLNNDWDLTCRVLELLMSRVEVPVAESGRDAWTSYESTIARCDVSPLAGMLADSPRPLSGLAAQAPSAHEFVRSLYGGDVGSGNVIKQIFQEIYLGKNLFESTYRLPARLHTGSGLIDRETLLAPPRLIERLAAHHLLAIATGRPAAEAAHPLKRFGIGQYFSLVYCLDDCLREEARILGSTGTRVHLSKPDPFMLDAIVRDIAPAPADRWYVGDMPDDMLAAARSKAGFRGVGVLAAAPDKAALRQRLAEAGADVILEDLEDLPALVDAQGGA